MRTWSLSSSGGTSSDPQPVDVTPVCQASQLSELADMSTHQNRRVVRSGDLSDLRCLPPDTGGKHTAHVLGETDTPYGFYIYLPGGYEEGSGRYPVLVFLHGAGECGNSAEDAEALELVLIHGPPYLIHSAKWAPTYPMLVVSPQTPDEYWQTGKIDGFIHCVVKNYRANGSRVYLTGLSMGADGVFTYLSETGDRSLVAAAVAICGEGSAAEARKARTPIWIFHGEQDDVVPLQTAVAMRAGFTNAPEARLTVYPDVDHGSWYQTYDLSGIGHGSEQYDPYDIGIYDWMLTYSLSD